jgi:hypothetical protein
MSGTGAIVLGTYDGHVLAFAVQSGGDSGRMLSPIFGLKAHQASVRSVCTSGRYAVSASADETMSVFDLAKVIDLGQLFPDTVGVSAVAMHGGSHLITGSDDGRMAIFRTSDWEQLTSMAAHPSGVASIAIHPSGRLALSLGKEPQLYTWNLMRAKCVLKRPLQVLATAVRWSPSGSGCALLSGKEVLLVDMEDADRFGARLAHEDKVLAFEYLSDTLLVSGGEDRALHVWDLSPGLADADREVGSEVGAHTARIKGLVRLSADLIASASTDGSLKLWRVRAAGGGAGKAFEQVDGVELGVRITCIAANADGFVTRKAAASEKQARKLAGAGASDAAAVGTDEGASDAEASDEEPSARQPKPAEAAKGKAKGKAKHEREEEGAKPGSKADKKRRPEAGRGADDGPGRGSARPAKVKRARPSS